MTTASETPTPVPYPLERLTVERQGGRWRASDGSFSFEYPPGTQPREPSVDGNGLWELESRGNALHMWIYVSDSYEIGSEPARFLDSVADGLVDGVDSQRRRLRRQGVPGLEVRMHTDGYRYTIRLFVVEGRFFQVTTGVRDLLDDAEIRSRANAFLESFRIHPGDVLTDS